MALRPSRLERITNLVLVLLDAARPLSLREIGGAVAGYPSEPGALRQAFERDKRTLRDGGIPVAVERLDGDDQVGYRILPEDYYLPDLALDPDEEEALAFALAAVRIEGGMGQDALAKLGGAPATGLPAVAVLPFLPALGALQESIRTRSPVTFAYRGRQREVEPYGLLFRAGAWYLVGHDRTVAPTVAGGDAGALRTFRVDRLEDAPVRGAAGAFSVPPEFDAADELRLAPWSTADASATDADGTSAADPGRASEATEGDDDLEHGGAIEVVIEVEAREARAVTALAGPLARRELLADSSVRLSFQTGDESAFLRWVLGCGDSVEVIAPPVLRASVVAALREAAS